MGEEWEQLRNKGPAFPPSALSNALVNKGRGFLLPSLPSQAA